MYLDIVIIDFLTPDGVLTSLKLHPKPDYRSIVVDRIRDIHPERFSHDELDIGGTRIYNAPRCYIDKITSHIRRFNVNNDRNIFDFQFEHMGVPVGASRDSHGGVWNFILPPGWRLNELYIVDPYDNKGSNLQTKKQFRYNVIWDKECNTQMIEMDLRSGRGSFSFVVAGRASLVSSVDEKIEYINSFESDWSIARLVEVDFLDNIGKDRLRHEIENKANWLNWLELKPNIAGIGININQIVSDSIEYFKKKIKNRNKDIG